MGFKYAPPGLQSVDIEYLERYATAILGAVLGVDFADISPQYDCQLYLRAGYITAPHIRWTYRVGIWIRSWTAVDLVVLAMVSYCWTITIAVIAAVQFHKYSWAHSKRKSVLVFRSTVRRSPDPPALPEFVDADGNPLEKKRYLEELIDDAPITISTPGAVVRNYVEPVIITPGVLLTERSLCELTNVPNLVLVPEHTVVHAHLLVTDVGPSFKPFGNLALGDRIISCVLIGKSYGFSVYSIRHAEGQVLIDQPSVRKVVDGKHFIISHDVITCVHPHLESVPTNIIKGISARLATSPAEPAKLYDQAGNFLRSKCVQRDIVVHDLTPWVILLCDAVNRASVSAAPSIRYNLPYGSNCITRAYYNACYHLGRINPFSSQPSNAKWLFPDIAAPVYEVFQARENAKCNEEWKPEPSDPFQVVREDVDASDSEEQFSHPRADDPECGGVNGEEGSGDTADDAPSADREEVPAGRDPDMDNATAVPDDVPASTDSGPDQPGVRDTGVRYVSPDCAERMFNSAPTEDSAPTALSIGDASLYCIPTRVDTAREKGVYRWILSVDGDFPHQHRISGLHCCGACAEGVANRAVGTKRSAYSALARLQRRGQLKSCRYGSEDERAYQEHASAASDGGDIPRGSSNNGRGGDNAGTSGVRGVGRKVPYGKKARFERGKGAGFRKRGTTTRRGVGKVLPENRDNNIDD
jgi:hypothetical protein